MMKGTQLYQVSRFSALQENDMQEIALVAFLHRFQPLQTADSHIVFSQE